MNVLVVAAHPDDELVGVGGTLYKHIERGDNVYVCIITKAYEPEWTKEYLEQKIKEQAQIDKIMDIKQRFNLDFPTVRLNTISSIQLNSKLAEVFKIVKPDVVYTHFEEDFNNDHSIVFQSCLIATRPIHQIELLSFEVAETAWSNKPFVPNFYVTITERQLCRKIKAFGCYLSETKDYPNPRSFQAIRNKAVVRGNEICMDYAEAFIQIRRYWL